MPDAQDADGPAAGGAGAVGFRPGDWPRPSAPRESAPGPARVPDNAPTPPRRVGCPPPPPPPPPHPADIPGAPAGRPARPDQFERRKQPPAFVAPENTACNQLPRHRRGVQTLTAEAACDPQPATPLADLRHAVHGLSNGAAPDLGNLDPSELGKDRADPPLNGGRKTLRLRRPGGLRARPHQAAASPDPEKITAMAVRHRSPTRYRPGKALAERRGYRGVAPNRQQRFRQPPQRRAQMDIAGEHDVGRAQPRRRRDDALANPRRIDADDRRVLENPRTRPSRQRGKAVDVFAAVDLKRLGIINAVEIIIGLELIAHAIDLPALHFCFEILAEHLQPADQLIADIDIGDLKRPLAQRNARNQLF